jgi:uncharacterized protein YutE (UPF0331/DUF86 family)
MTPQIDKEQIVLRLQHLKDYSKILLMLRKFSLSELEKDPFKKGALLHYLQVSAEICIDVGQIIISAENFSVPEDASRIFKILGEEKILPAKFAKEFSSIAGFRNLLVHEYAKIDMRRVYNYLQKDMDDFDLFARAIGKYLKRKRK